MLFYTNNKIKSSVSGLRNISLGFVFVAILCSFFADLSVLTLTPWHELSLMGHGIIHPNIWSWSGLLSAVGNTLAFAFQGVFIGALLGFLLSLFYGFRVVRLFCAFIRSIHELFWALLLMQVFGLSSLTGLLAIAIPYTGTLAKIYGEQYEETEAGPRTAINAGGKASFNQFFYSVLPLAWPAMQIYTKYRLECGIRSSIVLGFIGLPTLGFHLDTALKQGNYGDTSALIYVLIFIVFTLKWWLHKALIPVYVVLAFIWMPPSSPVDGELAWQFFSRDLIPAPLRDIGAGGLSSESFGEWFKNLWLSQAFPGLVNTIIVAQITLVLTGLLALKGLPLNSPLFIRGRARHIGDAVLIVLRTLPEYLLNFVLLLVMGPSMLPAILALSVHNAAIIAHLLGRESESLSTEDNSLSGINLYFYEVLPKLYRRFLAYLFYRWEIIMRETAMLGILGIPTLGFFIDSAFEALFFDRALVLILIAASLNMAADHLAHFLRTSQHLRTSPESI